ncbi:MAG: GGDEF domain-containing protein [Acidovorax sp.]
MPTERQRLIRMLFDEAIAMYANRDGGLLARFSEEFSGFTASGEQLVKGRSRWVDLTLQDFAQAPDRLRIETVDFHPQDLAPDLVAATGFLRIHRPSPDGPVTSQTVRLVLVFRLEATDDWRIVHSSISAPHGTYVARSDTPVDELHGRNRDLQAQLEARTQALADAQTRISQLLHTDVLTGLPNRRHAEALLSAAWASAQRSVSPLALVMVDIDAFKDFNTRYGRLAGDSCLQAVALALSQLAAQDPRGAVAVRWEGDVFMLLLPGADEAVAHAFAQRIEAAISALALPHEGASAQARVCASLGVACIGTPQREQIPQDLLRAVDRAVRQAKERGRNRIEPAPAAQVDA